MNNTKKKEKPFSILLGELRQPLQTMSIEDDRPIGYLIKKATKKMLMEKGYLKQN